MSGQRKRKHIAVEDDHTSKQTRSGKMQKSIHAFGSIAKKRDASAQAKKQFMAQQTAKLPTEEKRDARAMENKRKREVVSDSEDEIAVAPVEERKPKAMSTPRNKRSKHVAPCTPAETPTRGTLALFDRLKIDANARAIPFALQTADTSYDTPPDTPVEERNDLIMTLPAELKEIMDLHASFLSSLSLYYSHNGTSSPVNVAALLPLITKHWKKRDVTLEDLRRVLTVGKEQSKEFQIQDYGRGGICLSRLQHHETISNFINEDKLNSRFERDLIESWRDWYKDTPKENVSASAFLENITLPEIATHESVQKAAPLFARGQQRLADLKASKNIAKPIPKALQTTPQTSQATQSRGTALLDRILAKQNLASSLPSGPTKDQLERKSALHRIEDVARVLSLLAGTKERCSFSMHAITQHLQQSLRNPISREEVERCLELMSVEIVPGFVKIVQSKEVKGVVVARNMNVGLAELRARVEMACA